MSLDPRFFLLYNVQQVINDKDTGTALINGKLKFYQDASRSTPKDVYILSGSPPNYTYVNIGHEVDLGAAGSPMYNNNDVALYLFPYEGVPDDQSDIVQLYYYTCESEGEVSQFTREAQPNIESSGAGGETVETNYIPNGQFLPHLVLPADDLADPPLLSGQIRAPITPIAWGGWTFERPALSTAVDVVTFNEIGWIDPTTLPSNPPFAFNLLVDTADSGDTYKDLRVIFNDVNKFSGKTGTFSFWAKSETGATLPNCSVHLIKNFDGSAPTDTPQGASITIPVSWTQIVREIDFGDNSAASIGPDSYLQIALRFPTNAGFEIEATNFLLAVGDAALNEPIFPEQTNSETDYKSIAGFIPVPNPDGSDLYLPVLLTPTGLGYDYGVIGKGEWITYDPAVSALPPAKALAIGTRFIYQSYDSNGVPYSRLGNRYFNATTGFMQYGTGLEFTSAQNISTTNQIILSNNSPGAVANIADGTPATGFTFATIHTGAPTYAFKSYLTTTTTLYIEGTVLGAISNAIDAGTSGFTVAEVQVGTSLLPDIASVIPTVATSLASKYFIVHSTTQKYVPWFKVDGIGTEPVIADAVYIEIDLIGTDTAAIVAAKIRTALNGWQVSTILTGAASTLASGDNFTFSTTDGTSDFNYALYYVKDGVVVIPSVPGATLIRADILSADTNAQVAFKTQSAINKFSYALPDVRGAFIRMFNSSSTEGIIDYGTRFSMVPGIIGNALGSYEIDMIKSHFHTGASTGSVEIGTGSPEITPDGTTGYTGGSENIPKNINFNFVINY